MGSYILKRLLLTLFVVWAALTIMFVLFFVMPGDPVELKGGEKSLSPAVQANIRAKYGLDKPIVTQYGKYWGRLLRFDLDRSYRNDESVNKVLKEGIKTSGRLVFYGGMIQAFAGFGLGLLSAAKRYSLADKVTTVGSIALQGIPVFASGLLAQYFFGVVPFKWHWSWLNFAERWPDRWRLGVIPNGSWKGVVLPAIVVALVETALVARVMRSSMLEVLRADYMRTAAAKGLSRRTVILKHGVRNALIPVVTVFGLSLITMFGAAIQTEGVFSLPGLGSKIAEGALSQDTPMTLGLSVVVIVFAAVLNLLIDISYSIIDPRIRVGNRRSQA